MVKKIDQALRLLEDGQWRSLEDVERQLKLEPFKVGLMFKFLVEHGFVKLDEKERKVKLAPQCQTFLKELENLTDNNT